MTKTFLGALAIALFPIVSQAQQAQGGGYEANKKELRADRPALEENAVWTREDSITHIPAYELYGKWDTRNIHAYKEDLTKKSDTTMLTLEVNECDFAHPFEGKITSNFGDRGAKTTNRRLCSFRL